MPTPREDKRAGRLLPTPVTPPTDVCFKIVIPNAVQYRAALFGVLNTLGEWHAWDHPLDGTECVDCEEAAQLWRNAIAQSTFSDECGVDPMSCEDVADCIETSEAVRNAIGGIVAPRSPLADYMYPPGDPLPIGGMTTPLNDIDECAFNAFWAQVEQYVDYMANLGQDTLEYLEFYSNALETGQNVPLGQFVGKLKNAGGTGKVMEFLNWVGEVLKEAYEAGNNESNRLGLKCDLFCAYRDTCQITIQGTLDVINNRTGNLFNPAALNSIDALTDMLVSTATNPSIALDVWIGFLMGTAKTISMFGVQGMDETLNLMLTVAINDANNDWETLCDCAVTPTDCYDLVSGPIVTTPLNNNASAYGQQIPGEGYESGANQMAFNFNINTAGATTFTLTFNEPVNGTLNIRNQNGTQSDPIGITTGTGTEYVMMKPAGTMTTSIYIGFIPNTPAGIETNRIREICWS